MTGDVPRVEDIARRFDVDLKATARSRLGLSDCEADDIVQDVYLSLLRDEGRMLATWEGAGSLRAWLRGIVRHRCADAFRRRAVRQTVPLEKIGDVSQDPWPAAMDRLSGHELLRRMPRRSRRILNLYFVDDCSYREIAVTLDVPLNTVASRLSRARELARKRAR